MEISLEETLDILLEIISGAVAVGMMYVFMNAHALTTILERMV